MDGSQEAKPQSMGRKNDFIVWLRLNPMQRKVYEVSGIVPMRVGRARLAFQPPLALQWLNVNLSAVHGHPAPYASMPQACFLSWLAFELAQAFLNSDQVKAVFNQTNSALAALTLLKKICDHPALLSKRAEEGIVSGGQSASHCAHPASTINAAAPAVIT